MSAAHHSVLICLWLTQVGCQTLKQGAELERRHCASLLQQAELLAAPVMQPTGGCTSSNNIPSQGRCILRNRQLPWAIESQIRNTQPMVTASVQT